MERKDMLYSQPLATRFGNDLITHITSGSWDSLDIAVAWVRASGVAHLEPAMSAFLKAGKKLSFVVGVDFDNTTKEGLEGLLALEAHGVASTFLYHNEAGTIFHPKLYLFRSTRSAKLIIGSNNLTEAGLFQNVEAGLEIDATASDPVIVSALNALAAWRDTSLGLARRLDKAFLAELIANGYITDEISARKRMASRRSAALPGTHKAKKLFGGVTVTPPARPASSTSASPAVSPGKTRAVPRIKSASSGVAGVTPSPAGQVLLMRVRTARGTQVQLPIREPFFAGVTQIYSVATRVQRGIHATYAAREPTRPNTLKIEMPETAGMTEPMVRFERTASGMQFEVYDAPSSSGQLIKQTLQAGLRSRPRATQLTRPSDLASSTWWRII